MIVIDYITRVIDWSTSYIKAVRGIAGALVAIKRIFSRIYPFNKVLGGW